MISEASDARLAIGRIMRDSWQPRAISRQCRSDGRCSAGRPVIPTPGIKRDLLAIAVNGRVLLPGRVGNGEPLGQSGIKSVIAARSQAAHG